MNVILMAWREYIDTRLCSKESEREVGTITKS